jgi:hypothetical protein
MARIRKPRIVGLMLRLPEPLRRDLARAAKAHARSMNTEIIRRLTDSLHAGMTRSAMIANALLDGLDHEVVDLLVMRVLHEQADRVRGKEENSK